MKDALECLTQYDWPGNVRELENAIERAVVLGSSERVLLEDLPENVLEQQPVATKLVGDYHQAVQEAKQSHSLWRPSSKGRLAVAATVAVVKIGP